MKTLLVVEDDPSLRRMLSILFRTEGFEVKAAGDGVEGVKLARESDPSLIIFDLNMPEMDGVEFINETRRLGYDGPAVVLSGVPNAKGISRQVEADAFLQKPFDPLQLLDEVEELLERNQASSD